MGGLAPVGGSSNPGVNKSDAAREAEAARQRAEAARKAAEAARKAREAAEAARKAREAARQAAEKARQEKAAAEKAAADARKAAKKPDPTPEVAKKSQADAAAADTKRQQATEKAAAAEKKLQAAEEDVALKAKQAQDAMRKANTLAAREKQALPFSQKDIDQVKPTKNELASAFDGTNRKAELEKRLGTRAPPKTDARNAVKGEKPPAALDAASPEEIQAAASVGDGQTYTAPSSGTQYQVKKNPTTGETVLSDAKGGSTITLKPDGSYTSTVTTQEPTKEGGLRDSTWTKTSDAQGRPTALESRKRQTEQHPATGATTTTSTTRYDASTTPPTPRAHTDEVAMEKPPASLAGQPGVPQGPATVKTETQFNAQGLPTKQVKTTEVHTPGFKAGDVSAFEAGQDAAMRNAAKGEDHHRTNNAPTSLKPGESSLTITEETRFNAQGEPAVSTRRTESVATQPLKSDKNGNGVQVVRSQHEVTRGPKDADSTDALPALDPRKPGTVTQRTTVTGYDPDGSLAEPGHARRTRTVSQASGTVDAHGQMQLKHRPTEVQGLNEASDNRWNYDHVAFEVGADGQRVPGREPVQLDKEAQLPWYEDAAGAVADGLKDLADTAGEVSEAASKFVTAPLEEALTDEIKKLNSAGDSLTLSGNLDVKVGLKAGIAGEASIERTEDGKYQLSAEVTADVGVGLLGSASVSGTVRMEWKFDSPEEAAKAALTLGKGPSAMLPGSEDNRFLMDHLSAAELNVGGEAEAGVGGKAGPASAELSVSAGATTGVRVEFDKGKPTHLVRTTEFEGSGAAGAATGLKGKAGVNVGGEVSGSVSIESKIPLDSSKVSAKDVLAFMASPTTAAFAGPAETSVTVEGSVDAGEHGEFFTAEVSGLSGDEAQTVAKKLMDGQGEKAFEGVKAETKFTKGSFKDREFGVGAKLVVVDFDLNARHRDVTVEGGSGSGGTTASVGSGKRKGGSDGASRSNGPGGTNGPSGAGGPEAGADAPTREPGDTSGGRDDRRAGAKDTSARPPADTTRERTPPTEFRVNPATGQLVPRTPVEGGPSRSGRPETKGRPGATEAKGDTGPSAGRKDVPVVRNPDLPGRTTHVRYDDGKVRIEAGPDATPEDIQAHMATARVLQRYEGAAGKVRQLIDKVKQALTGMPGYGSQGFESRLEVQKLSGILEKLEATQAELTRGIAGATGKPNPGTAAQQADLERQISSVERQLRAHEAKVDSLVSGRGYVAREDEVVPVSDPDDEKLPERVPAWVSDVLPPHIAPADVVAGEAGAGGRDGEPRRLKPGTAHWLDDKTLCVTDSQGKVVSRVDEDRLKRLPRDVPRWVAGALPPHIDPDTVQVETSAVTNEGGAINKRLNNPKPDTAYWVDGRYLYVTDAQKRIAFVEGDLELVEKQVRNESIQGRANKQYLINEKGRWTPSKTEQEGEDGQSRKVHFKYRHDEGGHLVGAQFGGIPEFIGYVPQTRYQNNAVTHRSDDPRRRVVSPNPDGALEAREVAGADGAPVSQPEPVDESLILRNWYGFETDAAKHLRAGDKLRARITPQYISAGSNRPNALRVDGLLRTTEDGVPQVVRGTWVFGNSTRMDNFDKEESGR
jgi:hypothetical protein